MNRKRDLHYDRKPVKIRESSISALRSSSFVADETTICLHNVVIQVTLYKCLEII